METGTKFETRQRKLSKIKAETLIREGIIKIYNNEYNQEILDWKLCIKENNYFFISPDGKLKVPYILLKRTVDKAEKILVEVKKLQCICETPTTVSKSIP